jgi:hypothetical protein
MTSAIFVLSTFRNLTPQAPRHTSAAREIDVMTICPKLRAELIQRAALIQAGGKFDDAEQIRWFATVVA